MNIPQNGLPDHLFRYLSSISPLINIDLVVYDVNNGIYLSWRDDEYYGPGWHVPGGIIRYKEAVTSRIKVVAKQEIGIESLKNIELISINEIMNPDREIRGHFISLLFLANPNKTIPNVVEKQCTEIHNGTVRLHKTIPSNMISQHIRYIPILKDIIENENHSKLNIGNLLDSK